MFAIPASFTGSERIFCSITKFHSGLLIYLTLQIIGLGSYYSGQCKGQNFMPHLYNVQLSLDLIIIISYMYVTLSYLRSKAQAVLHNCTKLAVVHN